MTDLERLTALSPVDGRYRARLAPIAAHLSELALFRNRLHVEVEWLIHLSERPEITELPPIDASTQAWLRGLVTGFGAAEAVEIAAIEAGINHDVKAVEYWLKARLAGTPLEPYREFVHFACTSEDVNNLAYALMLRAGVGEWLAAADRLIDAVAALAVEHRALPMLARTHGQPATPTSLGKELAVFARRWRRQAAALRERQYLGKLNGAVGTLGAHRVAYPDAPWLEISRRFVEGLGLAWNPLTTQIEPHDFLAEVFHNLVRFNSILADFDADMWAYIGLGYLRLRVVRGEVGSSTMPHKVNPIDFENSEANAGMSSAVLGHLATRLPVSRMQRDLTDSSALRNIGVGLGHSYLAILSCLRGVDRVAPDEAAIARDLEGQWETLGEAVQTVMRKAGVPEPYERVKDLTRGERVTAETLADFVRGLGLAPADQRRLLELSPAAYTGYAAELVDLIDL
ncbi:MAG TPA: adenylosuccinate lyase [Candidatus Dormibacteraeota bacterium]|jgi:adenylosuccinate lyase|nr:adenylosuccinate lyase [Candidatus Dormibacteraeota bacterium]